MMTKKITAKKDKKNAYFNFTWNLCGHIFCAQILGAGENMRSFLIEEKICGNYAGKKAKLAGICGKMRLRVKYADICGKTENTERIIFRSEKICGRFWPEIGGNAKIMQEIRVNSENAGKCDSPHFAVCRNMRKMRENVNRIIPPTCV